MKAMRHIVTFIKNYLCAKDTKITDYSPMNETTPKIMFLFALFKRTRNIMFFVLFSFNLKSPTKPLINS